MAEVGGGRLPEIGEQVGGYHLRRLLGSGAMGAVFEAVGPNQTLYALKVVHPNLVSSRELVERFLREGAVGSSVQSPHVVPVVDSGSDPQSQQLYLVMPLLNGFDVAGLLERCGPVEPVVATKIVFQATLGLAAAHRAGVIHRDIKPSNLFIDYLRTGEVVVRICDFGVAKRAEMYDDSHLTRTGTSMGSPLYMSPEQVLSSKHVGEQTDVWSLGVTLYELLCGTTPFGDAKSIGELMVMITSRNARPIQERAPWVPPELARTLHRAIVRDAERRFETADAFSAALRTIIGNDIHLRADELRGVTDERRRRHEPPARLEDLLGREGEVTGGRTVGMVEGDPIINTTVAGQYRAHRLLGRGGMGSVYEADAPDGTRIALKIITDSSAMESKEARLRFERESRAATTIKSPHVVATFDAGMDPLRNFPYIAMELLKGTDLAALLKRQGAMPPRVVARVMLQAARGIAAAHSAGIVHRDIKPANLFLSVSRGTQDVTVKVCDFGVAKQLTGEQGDGPSHELTRTGGMLGSPAYMSPEQATSAKTVDERSDIWSLGISMYEALSGRRPWKDGDSLGQIIVSICTQEIRPVQDAARWLEPELAQVVHTMLQRDPRHRYATMVEVIAALSTYLGGDERLTRDELRGIDAETRAQVAPRLADTSPVSEGEGVASTMGRLAVSAAATMDEPRSRRGSWIVVSSVAVATVVAAGLVLVLMTRTGSETEPTAVSAEAPPSASAAREAPKPAEPSMVSAHVRYEPKDAEVRIDGEHVAGQDGYVRLEGLPGDSFRIEVKKGNFSREVVVVISRDGTASPGRVALDTPTQQPPAAAQSPGGKPTGGSPTPPSPAPATPTTRTPPPATPVPGGLDYVDEW